MEEYILPEVKQLAGIYEDDDAFDRNIVIYINEVFAELNQLHAGPPEGFAVSMNTAHLWKEFTTDIKLLSLVKSYVSTKVQLRFNPPASNVVVQEMHATLSECESRILNITDRPEPIPEPKPEEDCW